MEFEGHGPPNPKVVFIGLEEKAPKDADDLADSVKRRCNLILSHGLRGDKDAWHRGTNALTWTDGKDPLIPGNVGVWNYASRITAELVKRDHKLPTAFHSGLSEDAWKTEYKRLGTWSGITLLTEYMPFPRHDASVFENTYLEQWFKKKSIMNAFFMKPRLAMLRRLVSEAEVQYVFMYGATFRTVFPSIVGPIAAWKELKTYNGSAFVARSRNKILVRTAFYGGRARDCLMIRDIEQLVSDVAAFAALNSDEI